MTLAVGRSELEPQLSAGRAALERVDAPGADWDAFVHGESEGTFCHLAGWHDVLSRQLGARPFYLEARDGDGALVGVLPLARVKSLLLGDHLVSLPFLNYGGALGADEVRSALADEALRLGRELGVDTIELRSRKRERSALRPTDRRITVVLELPATADELWQGLDKKLRSQIRRPMKEGMTVRRGSGEVGAFYDVFAANMRDLGTPVLPRGFFESLPVRFPAETEVAVVYHGDMPVAAGLGFHHAGEFEITWASSLRSHNRMAPNMLLYWELLKGALERGSRRFNFGRCAPEGGTHRFKLQWGGADVPLGWSQWSDGAAGPPSPDGASMRLAIQAWQKLPLAVTRSLGPVIARWLP